MVTLLAHEWLAQTGGSENVFEQIRDAYPDAAAVCLWNDDPVRFPRVSETWLARSSLRGRKAAALPFMSQAWNHVDLDGIDRVVVSSHAFAHHLASRAARQGLPAHCYVHSPARYIWAPDLDQRGQSAAGRLGRRPLQRFDRRRAHSGVEYAANSHFVAKRIEDAWGQPSTVIYPPVDVEGIKKFLSGAAVNDADRQVLDDLPKEFVLGASRFVPYKRMECAIDVGVALDLPVVLAGEGPDQDRVRSIAERAGVPVTFVGRVDDSTLRTLYDRASLFVFMPVEDFGIMPVEAMAAGTPVLVNSIGGAAESVQLLSGGCTANPESPSEMSRAAAQALDIDMWSAVAKADQFSHHAFRARLREWAGA
ncbi:glycosyltransferase [Nocardioides sp. 616]|uniref:glycosyltransferase n=1 Tax=Nocardioides sp. 616 TaxID=2268090 RepID=UPI000CE46A83|nr:glycosyltransferase [Nocardioides sp. 616]